MINHIIGIMVLVLMCVSPILAGETPRNHWDREIRIDKFVRDAPLFIKGKSLPDIRNIGKLKREFTEKKPNHHDPKVTNTFITLQFDGLEIYGYLKSREVLWPIHITITKPQWKILNGLEVGMPGSCIIKVLGPPNEQKKNVKEYCGETECVYFTEDNETISKVEFYYYFD